MSTLNVRRAALLAAHPSPTLDLRFTDGGGLDPRITFTRASVASYFDVAGTLQSAASGAPRFDFDPVTHAAKGLLIEEARTNLLLNSATLGTQSVTVTAQAYTLSFYGTGTVTLSGVSTAGPLTGTGAFPARVSLTFTPTAGTLTLTVSGSVLNANLEAGSFATSAIVTAGASATRAADVATMPVASWFNAAAGTLECDVIAPDVVSLQHIFITLSDNSFNNRLYIRTDTVFYLVGQMEAGGSVGSVAGFGSISPGVPFKSAASYISNNGGISFLANGIGPAVSGTSPGIFVVTTLTLGANFNGGFALSGYIRRVRYWPRALGVAELQAVTR